jgi:hypothetical protein
MRKLTDVTLCYAVLQPLHGRTVTLVPAPYGTGASSGSYETAPGQRQRSSDEAVAEQLEALQEAEARVVLLEIAAVALLLALLALLVCTAHRFGGSLRALEASVSSAAASRGGGGGGCGGGAYSSLGTDEDDDDHPPDALSSSTLDDGKAADQASSSNTNSSGSISSGGGGGQGGLAAEGEVEARQHGVSSTIARAEAGLATPATAASSSRP